MQTTSHNAFKRFSKQSWTYQIEFLNIWISWIQNKHENFVLSCFFFPHFCKWEQFPFWQTSTQLEVDLSGIYWWLLSWRRGCLFPSPSSEKNCSRCFSTLLIIAVWISFMDYIAAMEFPQGAFLSRPLLRVDWHNIAVLRRSRLHGLVLLAREVCLETHIARYTCDGGNICARRRNVANCHPAMVR